MTSGIAVSFDKAVKFMDIATDVITRLAIIDRWEFEAWQVAFAVFAAGTGIQLAVAIAACEWDWRRRIGNAKASD